MGGYIISVGRTVTVEGDKHGQILGKAAAKHNWVRQSDFHERKLRTFPIDGAGCDLVVVFIKSRDAHAAIIDVELPALCVAIAVQILLQGHHIVGRTEREQVAVVRASRQLMTGVAFQQHVAVACAGIN